MSVRVLFVYPDFQETTPEYRGAFYAGLGYLSAALKREGHDTRAIHITTPKMGRRKFMARLSEEAPHLIAFSSATNMFPVVKKLVSWIGEADCRVPTICGGVHPTLAAEEAVAVPGLDMICLGEGEEALVELCEKLEAGRDYTDIRNIWVKVGDKVYRNPLRPPIQDLDSLPFPDREIFDYPNLHQESKGIGVFMGSRGCPFSCTYCSNKALREVYKGKGRYVRLRSPENIVAEIKEVTQRYPFIKSVCFDDDIFFLKREFAEEFASLYPREVGLPFSCNMHPSFCNKATVRLLKQAGCWQVRIGLESGNERIRKEVLNRNLSQEVMLRAFLTCKEEGMKVRSFQMVGLPQETPRAVMETIKLNALVGSDEIQTSIFQPYPCTELFEVCREEGLMSGQVPSDYYYTPTLNLELLTRKQVFMFRSYFRQLVYLYRIIYSLPWPISRLAEKALDGVLCFKYTPEPFVIVFPLLKTVVKHIAYVWRVHFVPHTRLR